MQTTSEGSFNDSHTCRHRRISTLTTTIETFKDKFPGARYYLKIRLPGFSKQNETADITIRVLFSSRTVPNPPHITRSAKVVLQRSVTAAVKALYAGGLEKQLSNADGRVSLWTVKYAKRGRGHCQTATIVNANWLLDSTPKDHQTT
jgi:hypothetical protein